MRLRPRRASRDRRSSLRAFPALERLAERGDVGADEVGDAAERRANVDAPLDKAGPDAVSDDRLHAVPRRPSRLGLLRHRSAHDTNEATRARTTPSRSNVRATRSARSSRHGGAMSCTPIGNFLPSVHTGAATTGKPMNEIGWVKIPIFGRTSISFPSRTKVFWPRFGARHG